MKQANAEQLLSKVMDWNDTSLYQKYVPKLQLLASFKYDQYQRFGPGRRFIESLALWLNNYDLKDRQEALDFIIEKLIYISEEEIQHIVQMVYPDLISQELIQIVAAEENIPDYYVGAITSEPRFNELRIKSIYLGLSDGAHTSALRRYSSGSINNEQIWQAYELSKEKVEDMVGSLKKRLEKEGHKGKGNDAPKFNLIWLLDDFSASGSTYIRYKDGKWKGKIKKIYERLNEGDLIDTTHYEIFLVLYVATSKAVNHIEYWAERFTSENGYKGLQLKVLHLLEDNISLKDTNNSQLSKLLTEDKYYDERVHDEHFEIGGTKDAKLGFAGCALPVVLFHNTPNNSVYTLWAYDDCKFKGLFPRVSRHKELS